MTLVNQYEAFLTAKGRRFTDQTARVVAVVASVEGTFDADRIVKSLAGEASRASRATVFRTLAGLIEADLVRRVQLGGREVLVVTAEDRGAGGCRLNTFR